MKIYFYPSTAGRYGGGLSDNLRYFAEFLNEELKQNHFESSFEEIFLKLFFPPLYVLPGVKGIEKDFMKNYYQTLPNFRVERRYKRISASLQAPEFSEHEELVSLSQEDPTNPEYKDIVRLDVAAKYKGFSEVYLAQLLITRIIEVIDIVKGKFKEDDFFDVEDFKNILLKIKLTINESLLEKIATDFEKKLNERIMRRVLESREKRRRNNLPKDKLIRDLRVYPWSLPDEKALSPFNYLYAEIFLHLLKREGFMCPGYHHLYITVGSTEEEALRCLDTSQDWHVYGIAVLDYEEYMKLDLKDKEKKTFEMICAGLYDIAEIDKLDKDILKRVIDEIKIKGLDTELIHYAEENEHYEVSITYFVKPKEEGCPIYLSIKDKITEKSMKKFLGKTTDSTELHYWFNDIHLRKNQLTIKSGKSFKASLYTKGKPKLLTFNLEEELSSNNT